MKEKLLNYSWGEFIKTPFSLMFFILFVGMGYLLYDMKREMARDKAIIENKYIDCVDRRVKDRDMFLNLLKEVELNKILKKDSVK